MKKDKKVDELIEVLEQEVKNFKIDPDHFKALLGMKALMPNYSLKNLIVVMAQLPAASYLASFKRWNGLGRRVKHGSKIFSLSSQIIQQFERGKERNSVEQPIAV